MKNVAYLLFFTGLIFASCEGSDEVGITEYVMASEAQYIHGSTGIDSITSYYTYDQGKLVKIEVYTPAYDQPWIIHDYTYDENNQLLNSHVLAYSSIDKSKYQENFYSYLYNVNGKIDSKVSDSLIQYFDEPVTVTIPEQTDYQYDEQLRLVAIHWHNEYEGNLRKFIYDNQSNLIKEEYFSNAEDTEPSYVIEYKNFDSHPNPFYAFTQNINIPFYELGYSYSAHNVLEEKIIDFRTSQENTNSYEYVYGDTHDLPIKIFRNEKLIYEFTYENLH